MSGRPTLPVLDDAEGVTLPLDAYLRDFESREWQADHTDSWKLERRQQFQEPGNQSWEASLRGDWDTALRLIDSRRDGLRAFAAEADRHGIGIYRVRVVEHPLTPYLRWELASLRVRAECGERIRVIGPEAVAQLEKDTEAPELLTVAGTALYRIIYDGSGVLSGAVRFLDTDLVARCEAAMRALWNTGEDMATYYAREVAPLPPPTVA